MTRSIRAVGILAALVAAACGGTDSPGGFQDGTATVSGALSGSIAVHATAGYVAGLPMNYSFVTSSSSGPNVTFNLSLPGTDLVDGTYTASNLPLVVGQARVLTDSTKIWSASAGTGQPTRGSLTLTIKGYGTSNTVAGTKSWLFVHGTLNATLEADPNTPGASGTVTVSATF